MKNINIKPFIYGLVGMSAILWFAFAFFSDLDLSKAKDFFAIVPKVVSADLLVIAAFVKWGWKHKVFRGWLVPFPDLNGTWKGTIRSDWIDSEAKGKLAPIPTILTIKQTFFRISCVMRTHEMASHSYIEGFLIDPERQIRLLSYTYTSKPRQAVADRSAPHDGTTLFEIVEASSTKLKGRYWTERKTTGEIHLDYHSKALLEELPAIDGPVPSLES